MSRKYPRTLALGLLLATFAATDRAAADPPPEKLPSLPPPEQTAPAPRAKEARPIPVTRVPVELRIPIEDLEKHLLRELVRKIDPKAEPKLPVVVKGNEREFALGADAPADKPAEGGKENAEAKAPQLLPRPPGARPRLDRMAGRPLIAGVVDRLLASIDLHYRIELRSFKLTAAGNTITCEVGGGFHCEGKAAALGAAMPNVRDLGIKISVVKNLEWGESGKLELKEGTTKIWIDPDAALVGFPRLDVERVVRLNGFLGLLNGVIDRELMKQFSGENLPDLAALAPSLKDKMPFLAISELTAYPIRGDEKNVYFAFEVGLVAAKNKTDSIAIATKAGPAPEPKVRGRILFDKDGKLEIKLSDK